MNKIVSAFAEYIEDFGGWVVLLDREGDEDAGREPMPLRSILKIEDDPMEGRLAWDAMVFCLADMKHGDPRDEWQTFADEKAAKRVAKRCVKSIKEIAKGKPALTGFEAQLVATVDRKNKGTRIPGYQVPAHWRGRILGVE